MVLQQVEFEGPGRITPVFRDFGIPLEVRRLYRGDEVPTDLDEIRVLIATLDGADEVQTVVPLGWGGDRFRVYDAPGGPALVWYAVWDDARSAGKFLSGSGPALRRTARPGYRAALDSLGTGGRPLTRYVLAPDRWARWDSLPGVSVRP